jgi:hypothetical protein
MRKMTLDKAIAFLRGLMADPKADAGLLMRGNKPIAVIVPVGDADLETVALSFSPTFNAIWLRSQKSGESGRTYSCEEIRKEFDLLPGESPQGKPNGRKSKSKVSKRLSSRQARGNS